MNWNGWSRIHLLGLVLFPVALHGMDESRDGMAVAAVLQEWRPAVEQELTGNILPFWKKIEKPGGGYVGGIRNDLTVVEDSPVSLLLVTRLMWAYSHAYLEIHDTDYLGMASRAYPYLNEHFGDVQHGGYFWMLDSESNPLNRDKYVYGQAFAIYALSEYYRASGDRTALDRAMGLFALLEEKAWEPDGGGYWEAFSEDWGPLQDLRLSSKDFNTPFTMNAHLHVLEAYTNLYRASGDEQVGAATRKVLRVMLDHVVVPDRSHFGLFFDADWKRLDRIVSPGHDIEGSWLMWETANLLGDPALLEEVRAVSVAMARHTLTHGIGPGGQVLEEFEEGHPANHGTSWWSQAEGMVGFLNAWQMTGDPAFLKASHRVWEYIQSSIVDHEDGEWFAGRDADGKILSRDKVGPWKAPYHNTRACLEVLERTVKMLPDSP